MIRKLLIKKNGPLFIGEVSCNHNGSIKNAKKIIDLAKDCKADFVKLQTYTGDTLTLNSKKKDFKIKSGLWKNYTLWDLYNSAQTPFNWQKELFHYANKKKIKCFSTPFDETAVDLLENLKCPVYKIASFEITHLPLIKRVAETKKPIIISTGMSNLKEIDQAVNTAQKNGTSEIVLLYCVSNYPSKIGDFNLKNIQILKEKFGCIVGFSDHSNDRRVTYSAVLMGADLVERHIALQNQKKSLDIQFSSKGKEIKNIIDDINCAWNLRGKSYYFRNKSESKNKIFRRSIYAKKEIKMGEKFTTNNIKVVRPGYGLSPKYFEKLLNRKSKNKYFFGDRIKQKEIK